MATVQADGVISDILITGNVDALDADFADFMTNASAPGYVAWRRFSPGDYEYSDALVRLVVESTNTDRALVTGLLMTVDVPDLNDRGSVTITDSTNGASVAFARNFHVVPEVTLTIKSGSGTNPVIAEYKTLPSSTGFVVRMRDTITGAYVTGSLSWSANAY